MSRPGKNPYARPDARTRAAKASGYPARSVFKLKEIDERWRLLRPGQRVLDLGASPGSWAMYASERVGKNGRVVAVDLKDVTEPLGDNVVFERGDVFHIALRSDDAGEGSATAALANAPYQAVLSDMAPSTSGSKGTDQARSFELFARALDVARALGDVGSIFVGKLFMSADFQQAKLAVSTMYDTCRVLKPEGTRKSSTEIYLVGIGKKSTGR